MLAVWAVDPNRIRRGQLDVLDCAAVVRDADVGTWTVTVADEALARRIGDGWRILIADDSHTISGPVLSYGADLADRSVTLTGEDDLTLPGSRLVYPDPTRAATAQTTDAYYKRTGPAETVIRDMIHDNLGAGALAVRQADGLAVAASQGRGSTVTTNLRFKNLLEESRALARAGGVTFSASQEDDGQIWVRFRTPRDLTRRVRFNQQNGGLAAGSYQLNGPTVTSVLVAGQGEGTARTITEHLQDTTWGRRIEVFQDRRDTDDPAELEQAGTDTLAEGAAGAAATVEVNEVPGHRFGTDYQLGDRVSVEFGAVTITAPVRAVELSWDGHGRTAQLSLGDHQADDDQDPAWVKHVRDLNARLRGLETR